MHPGQGTANRRFFFRNFFLELLWVDDAAQAQREPAAGTRLWERWSQRNGAASPFGLLLRPQGEAPVDLPFPTWSYRPSYLPPGASLEFACGVPLGEPALVVMNWQRGPGVAGAEPVDHPAGFRELLHVCVGVPSVDALSAAAQIRPRHSAESRIVPPERHCSSSTSPPIATSSTTCAPRCRCCCAASLEPA